MSARIRKNRKDKPESTAFKIRLRGKDGAPLAIGEVRDGLYEAVRRLLPYARNYRVKWLTVYLVAIDEDGNEVRFNLQLDLVPMNGGRIVLRTPKEDEANEMQATEQGA